MTIKQFNNPSEKLYRAVRLSSLYWDSENRVSSVAFNLRPQENGVSFDRADGRSDEECCKFIYSNRLQGKIISLTVFQCLTSSGSDSCPCVRLEHAPTANPYHSELLYLIEDKNKLKQIKHQLALVANVEPY